MLFACEYTINNQDNFPDTRDQQKRLKMTSSWISILVIGLILMITSCETTDPADDPVDQVEKFIGTWNVSDQPARLNYVVNIERSPVFGDRVILVNFADMGNSAIGFVVNNTIVIDEQEIGVGFKTEGSGTFINDQLLEFEFFLDDGIDKELRKAIFTK